MLVYERVGCLGNNTAVCSGCEHRCKPFALLTIDEPTSSRGVDDCAQVGQYAKSLADANRAIEIRPRWVKGWSRKALAHFYSGDYQQVRSPRLEHKADFAVSYGC